MLTSDSTMDREGTVSLRDLAPCGDSSTTNVSPSSDITDIDSSPSFTPSNNRVAEETPVGDVHDAPSEIPLDAPSEIPLPEIRRSGRTKIPTRRYVEEC
jgi:hypothetical protein